MSLIEEYFQYQVDYEKTYGKDTIVLIEIGQFFEFYGLDNDLERIGKVAEIADTLNIQLTRRNKSVRENSRKNPLMAGFQSGSLKKYLKTLIQANYTVVLVEQVTEPPNPERKVTQIISPSTYLEDSNLTPESNYLISIYIEESEVKTGTGAGGGVTGEVTIGLTGIDLSTGKTVAYEVGSQELDDNFAWDETYRFLTTYCPRETLINSKNLTSMSREQLLDFLELGGPGIHCYLNEVPKEYYRNSYQNKFLEKIYLDTGFLTPIEHLDLERFPTTVISMLLLLQFAYQHNEEIVKNVSKPEIWDSKQQLVLDYNSIYQLNVLPGSGVGGSGGEGKYNSLLSVVKNTSTAMGGRLLKERLLTPIADRSELKRRYSQIEEIMEIGYKKLERKLQPIMDIERLRRRMSLGSLQPSEFYALNCCYVEVQALLDYIERKFSVQSRVAQELPSPENRQDFRGYQSEYLKTFCVEVLECSSNLGDFKGSRGSGEKARELSFFNRGVHSEIDSIVDSLAKKRKYLSDLAEKLAEVIEKKTRKQSRSGNGAALVKVEYTDRDGHYLAVTAKRCEVLRKHADPELIKDLEFTAAGSGGSSGKKITSALIRTKSDKILLLSTKLERLLKEKYLETLEKYTKQYSEVFEAVTDFVAVMDVLKSNVKTAKLFGYCRPSLDAESHGKKVSSINAVDLRHPLVERILLREPYIPNDLEIGGNGIVLYSVNAGGKSCFLKAVGCNLIMAQAGMFVAASEFRFAPFEKIITRIAGGDNILRAKSSFAVEMDELRSILRRGNSRSLILGDEICHGSEQNSGLAIVAAAIIELAAKNCNFILATHLHRLASMPRIEALGAGVRHFHFQVLTEKNSETGEEKLVYNRTLQPGNGSSIYGIEVARAMGLSADFIRLALEIRREESGISEKFLESKRSRYNKRVIVDLCGVCGERAVDTHHIKEQRLADCDGIIEGRIQKKER